MLAEIAYSCYFARKLRPAASGVNVFVFRTKSCDCPRLKGKWAATFTLSGSVQIRWLLASWLPFLAPIGLFAKPEGSRFIVGWFQENSRWHFFRVFCQ